MRKNRGGNVKDNSVGNYHIKNTSKSCRVMQNQMKPRVKNDRLTSDHHIPTDCDQRKRQPDRVRQLEELEQEAQRIRNHTDGRRQQQTPKVETTVPTEDNESEDNEFDSIAPCNPSEGCDRELYRQAASRIPSRKAI